MTRGRKPNLVPTIQWSIMVPVDLAFKVETALMDPVTKRATYSARSRLLQGLLHDWLNGRAQAVSPDQVSAIMDLVRKHGSEKTNAEILQMLLDTSGAAGDNSREESDSNPAHNSPEGTTP